MEQTIMTKLTSNEKYMLANLPLNVIGIIEELNAEVENLKLQLKDYKQTSLVLDKENSMLKDHVKKLAKRIHNQRVQLRDTWEILEQRWFLEKKHPSFTLMLYRQNTSRKNKEKDCINSRMVLAKAVSVNCIVQEEYRRIEYLRCLCCDHTTSYLDPKLLEHKPDCPVILSNKIIKESKE